MALGIGANIAIFSLVNALLLRPISGVREAERLVRIDAGLPSTILDDLGKEPVFAGACGVSTPLLTTEFHGEVEPVGVLALTGACADVLGLKTELGRMLTPADDREENTKVAVLTDAFWRRAFAGRPDAIGSTIRIDGTRFTIVGVTDPEFQGILLGFRPGIVVSALQDPSSAHISQRKRPYAMGNVFARLRPGISIEQAQARLSISQERLLADSAPPDYQGESRQAFVARKLKLLSGTNGLDYMLRNRYSRPLGVSLGICALVLLVSCVNLANLLLARGVRRRGEIALRLALGASRSSIAWQLTVESVSLVLLGSLAGLVLAYCADRVLLTQVHNAMVNFSLTAPIDTRVLAFAVAATLLTGIGFGMIPAWRSSDVNLIEVLKATSRGVRTGSAAARFLIAAQIALTLALVAGTGLFVSSLARLRDAPLGFRAENVVEAQLFPAPDGYKNFTAETYYRELLRQIEALPGVESASYSNFAPLFSNRFAQPVRFTSDAAAAGVGAQTYWVSDNFLPTMNIPLMAGRDFGRTDSVRETHTAIVSQSLARRLSPANEVIGRHIRLGMGSEDQDLEVIGIAADARLANVREDPATVYVNLWQYSYSAKYGVLMVRERNLNAGFLHALENAVRGEGREYVQSVRTLEQQRESSLLPERLLASMSLAFGGLALALASTGLYGLTAYDVASRTGEIGIRMALGATRHGVRWLVVGDALRLAGFGCTAGLLLALGAGRFAGTLLYGVRPFEPVQISIAVAILLATSGAAAWIPAHRASRIDPLVALRHE